ncbi:MAG: outer membrane lipoprotein-sorting protein [Candidatus Marinimicrobia bacterium]|nr:outer membrane lipoprotein-sorting protein [Candidatus Neomarinimicrobiota bacterium]
MRAGKIVIAILIFILYLFPDQKGDEILKKVTKTVSAPKDMKAIITIELIDKNGNKRHRKAEMYTKEDEKRIIRFTEPADQRGIAFLALPGDIQYLYMPAFRKVRRIASHIKNTKFAGTDFTYEDLATSKYDKDFKANILKETDSLFTLELIPKPGVNKSYSKLIMHVRKDIYFPTSIEFYDKNGEIEKILYNKKIDRHGNYWHAKEMLMDNLKENHKTRMIFDEVTFDTNISDDIFTQRQLIRWR